MSDQKTLTRLSMDRRRLLQLLGLAGALPGLALVSRMGVAAEGDDKAKPAEEKAAQESAAGDEPEITEEAKALADLAKQRYGKYLEDDEIAGLTEDLNYGVRAGERLRKAELTNADEPDFIYRAGF